MGCGGCLNSGQRPRIPAALLIYVGLVSKIKDGRETLYELDPAPIKSLQEYLDVIAAQWESKLQDLKVFMEDS
jgi:hypothetical protein